MSRIAVHKKTSDKEAKDKKELASGLSAAINKAKIVIKEQNQEIENKQKLKNELKKETTDMVVFVTDYEEVKNRISEEVSIKQKELSDLEDVFEQNKIKHHNLLEKLAGEHADLLEKHQKEIEVKITEKELLDKECIKPNIKLQKIVDTINAKEVELSSIQLTISELKKTESDILLNIKELAAVKEKSLEEGNLISSSLANLKEMYDNDYVEHSAFKKKAADVKYDLNKTLSETKKALEVLTQELESKVVQIASINRRDEGARAEKERLERIAKRLGVQLAVI